MSKNGSAGNVIAAICSFFYAGLGQLVQGRIVAAIIHFLLASLGWFFFMGWIVHLYSTYDAAVYSPEK